tara:strand:- start:363 stop:887 length:525 start_codon:yes stop_codon:yes gene_type:complete
MPPMQEMGVGRMTFQDEVEWCLRLWNSLRIGGVWTLEGVGTYVRTDLKEMTLTEIHIDRATPGDERSLFDHHDYLATLAREIGWEMEMKVERAFTFDGEFTVPEDRIGDVAVCNKKCGAIARVEPIAVEQTYYKLTDGECPVCGKKGFTKDWHDLHVVIDDRGATLKAQKEEEE